MRTTSKKAGFTLIELLTVIAIIGILAGILIPVANIASRTAKKAQTKAQFAQWSTAMGQFKQEYGYFPKIDGTTNNLVDAEYFAGALTGYQIDGSEFSTNTNTKLCGNKRKNRYYTFTESELDRTATPFKLMDAFGNNEFGVIYDKDGDGILVTGTDTVGGAPAVKAVYNDASFTPTATDLPMDTKANGLRATVIFYSAGWDGTSSNAVMSWK